MHECESNHVKWLKFYVPLSPRLTEDIENRRDRKIRDMDRKEKSGGDDKDDDRRREERRKRREKEKRRRERREDEREVTSNSKVSIFSCFWHYIFKLFCQRTSKNAPETELVMANVAVARSDKFNFLKDHAPPSVQRSEKISDSD